MFIPFSSNLDYFAFDVTYKITPRVGNVSVRLASSFLSSFSTVTKHATNSYKRKWEPRHQSQLAQQPAQLRVVNTRKQLHRGPQKRHQHRSNNRRRSEKLDQHIIPRSRLRLRAQRVLPILCSLLIEFVY